RYAVEDHMIDGGPAGFAETAIVQRCGIGAMIHPELKDEAVDVIRRDAGADFADEHVQRLCSQAANAAHALKGFCIMNLDPPDIAFGGVNGICIAHIASCSGLGWVFS